MKKICYIATVSMTLQSFVVETAKYLHMVGGFDISFICSPDEAFAKSLPSYIHYYPVSMQRGISLGGIKAMFEIQKIFVREKFDLIQYSTPNASCYASIAGFLARIPVRLYCQWGIVYVGMSGVKRQIFKLEEKFVCALSTWIEPDSYGNLNFCHREKIYPQNKGSVIWNGSASGVDLNKFDISKKSQWRTEIRKKYDIPEKATVYIFVGRVTRDKGIDELLAAFRKLSNKYEDIVLLIVGCNDNPESINVQLMDWSLQETRVIYCGMVNTVECYLGASDIYVLPSYREGFGSSVIEAEAMGIPVIVTDIPGPTDAIEKDVTGLTVKKQDPKALFVVMEKLYSDQLLRERMGVEAYKWVCSRFEQKKLHRYILEDRKRLLEKE